MTEGPARYCGNCGNELGSGDQFCPNCGRPTHVGARVPTPEADVPVPPPVQQSGTATAGGSGAATAGRSNHRTRNVFIGVLVCIIALAALIDLANGPNGDGEGAGGGSDRGGGGDNPTAASVPADSEGASEDQYLGEEIDTFTRENYGVLVANPDEHVGTGVDITGQLLDNPEKDGSDVYFQMWADPVKIDWNTVVAADESAIGLRTDDYVRVAGTVVGSFEGENAFGGSVNAVGIEANEVERVEAVDAVDPTQETIYVDKTVSADGFSMTVQKLEFGLRNTRAYVTARNDGEKTAKLDFYRCKIFQGSDQAGQTDPYDYNLQKPQAALRTGEDTEGVIIFGRSDPSRPLQLSFGWESGGYMSKRPEPIVFDVAPSTAE